MAGQMADLQCLEDWLKQNKLETYLQKFIDCGYDDVDEIVGMSDELLTQLARDVEMSSKPNHVRRLRSAVATTKGQVICGSETPNVPTKQNVHQMPTTVRNMVIPNPHTEKLKYFNELLIQMYNSIYEFLSPVQFKSYVIAQRQMRWKVLQEIEQIQKFFDNIIINQDSKDGHAINTRKYQTYPTKPTIRDVKSAENTKEYLDKFINKVNVKITELRERSSMLFNQSHEVPAYRSNELSFYTDHITVLDEIMRKTQSALNNVSYCHNQLRKRFFPKCSENAEERRKKRRAKENKQKTKKRKEARLQRSAEDLLKVLSPKEPTLGKQYITKEDLSSLNNKFLAPRKHLQPLRYLMEQNVFTDDAKERVESIISVLEVHQLKEKNSPKQSTKKCKKQSGQRSLLDMFNRNNHDKDDEDSDHGVEDSDDDDDDDEGGDHAIEDSDDVENDDVVDDDDDVEAKILNDEDQDRVDDIDDDND